ncbi:hypothetical protein [Campylobacter devanensis]|nr:hypothetical protein [Campylobacter sp. P093]
MQILSHRGWWQYSSEKNHLMAFKKEFEYCLKGISQPYRGGAIRFFI